MTNLDLTQLKVAVIMGGHSAERQVSLRSGAAVIQALKANNIKTTGIDGVDQLLNQKDLDYDVVFNILHGEAGENGELAAVLSALKINYTGSNMAGGVLSWNKDIAKTLVSTQGLMTPKSQQLTHLNELAIDYTGPWIVKPTQEGSSVGLFYAQSEQQLKNNIQQALQLVPSILVEKFIKGTECTVAIVDNKALPVVRIQPAQGMYDYDAKYKNNGTEYFCPSGFSQVQELALKNDALTAFHALELKGWARIDFIVDPEGNRWFLEANTTPGMTETSLVPKAAKAIGWSFNELVMKILATAFIRENNQ